MRSGEATIKDIARELNISPSTVSRALKNHPDISQATKKNVKAVAEALHYRPNSIALSLRNSQTFTIGVIIPEIVHFYFSTVISGIEEVASERGYHILLCQSSENYEKEVKDAQLLYRSRVDGLLVSLSRETKVFDHLDDLQARGIPLVFFDRIYDGFPASQVQTDDYSGAYAATKHLIENGYKRIAHLAGPDNLILTHTRIRGYKDAIDHAGLTFREEMVYREPQHIDFENGYHSAKHLMALPDPPDAFFAHQDLAAMGAMRAVKESGYRIPDDIGIVGFSNWLMSKYSDPPLTTINQKGYEMGKESTELLISQIQHVESGNPKPFVPKKRYLKTELIIRESSVRT